MEHRKLLTITEAAQLAGCGRSIAYRFVNSGEWPSVKIGGMLRIPRDGFDEWIAAQGAKARERAERLREGGGA